MNFNILHSFDLETEQYIAEIPEFNLADYWNTIDEADNNIKKTLTLYLKELISDKKLNSKSLQYA